MKPSILTLKPMKNIPDYLLPITHYPLPITKNSNWFILYYKQSM
ncbi:hypothetical protein BGP_3780 [Beggiatoa sp. PS]|nr:hypothetical protein BGP_3780 [Beggiatoa sp. PS]